ncbi:MAG: hypothetical protein RLZZ165_977 [Bacteroidota bacterium]
MYGFPPVEAGFHGSNPPVTGFKISRYVFRQLRTDGKPISHIVTVLIALLSAGGLKAQSLNQGTRTVEAKIALKGAEVKGNYIVITYEIPYSGVVEIRLFDSAGQKIWQNQYADTFGKNSILLNASRFSPGETYAYQLNYKRDQIKEGIVIPPSFPPQ